MKTAIFSLGFAFVTLCGGHCLAVPAEIMPTPTAPEEPRIARAVFTNASLREIVDFLSRKRRELAPHSSPIRVVLDLPTATIDARRISITFRGLTLDEAVSALATTMDLRVVAVDMERQLKLKETNPK